MPPQELDFLIDTGSAPSFVVSPHCIDCPADVSKYEAAKSTTHREVGTEVRAGFGWVDAKGTVGLDTWKVEALHVLSVATLDVTWLWTCGMLIYDNLGAVPGVLGLKSSMLGSQLKDPK